jgi:hypothetical protein
MNAALQLAQSKHKGGLHSALITREIRMKLLVLSARIEGVEKGEIIEVEGDTIPAKYLNLVSVFEAEKPKLSEKKLEASTPSKKQ